MSKFWNWVAIMLTSKQSIHSLKMFNFTSYCIHIINFRVSIKFLRARWLVSPTCSLVQSYEPMIALPKKWNRSTIELKHQSSLIRAPTSYKFSFLITFSMYTSILIWFVTINKGYHQLTSLVRTSYHTTLFLLFHSTSLSSSNM